MSEEFLAALALEVWYQMTALQALSQHVVLRRDQFIELPVYPVLTPCGAAQLFAANLQVLGIQSITVPAQKPPVMPRFARK